jgi:hypothetical protein
VCGVSLAAARPSERFKEIDYSARGAGKTTRLIEWLRQKPERILITVSHNEENRLKRLYPELSTRIVDWRSYQQRYMHGSPIKEVSIDNADLILQEMFRQRISRVSISDDNEAE